MCSKFRFQFYLVFFLAIVTASVLVYPVKSEALSSYVDQVRFRALYIQPDESANLSAGGDVEVEPDLTPEIDFSHYFTQSTSAELILGTSTHKVSNPGVGGDLGEVSLVPATILAQYHFLPEGTVRPYAGAGVNYTLFYDEGNGAQDVRSVNYDNEFGWALQAGFDMDMEALGDNTSLNVDVKKVFLETDVSATTNTSSPVGVVATSSGDVELDPLVFGVGVSYRY